ncbi:MAG: HNH endonuclease [Defluviitaleaceae bacterium]|nr:HNH endonuclease [Defluviitaleaceae bacterium]
MEKMDEIEKIEKMEKIGITKDCTKVKTTKITRSLSSYTEEHRQFLEDNVQERSYSAMATLFNVKFGTNITHKTIRNLCRRFGLTNGKPDRRPYSDEQIEFLRENVKGVDYSTLAEMFNERFGMDGMDGMEGMDSTKSQVALIEGAANRTPVSHVTATQVGELCRAKGFSNGLDTRFQEKHTINAGRKRANALPNGAEIINADGYTLLKSNGVWRFKHITLWEQAHGRSVHEGHYIVFGDGNKGNFDKENLFCMTATQNAIRTRNGLQGATPELAAAGVALAKLYSQIGEREKVRKKKPKFHRKRVLKAN